MWFSSKMFDLWSIFDFAFSDPKSPENPSETVDADKFWGDLRTEIIGRCVSGGVGVKIKPSYNYWAPDIGPDTRKDNNLFNTEYEKITSPDPEETEPVPEETIGHLLSSEKLGTVQRFARALGMSDKGSKYDLIATMRKNSISKAKIQPCICFSIWSFWWVVVCNMPSFLLRSESPRDYADFCGYLSIFLL